MPFLAPGRCDLPLVGREHYLGTVKARLLSGPEPRRVAIRGLPGVGKTAVATELAYDGEVLAHFGDGVLWAALGQSRDVMTELGRWAEALKVGDAVKSLTTAKDRADLIRATIGRGRMLLVADGVWQTQDAATLSAACGPACGFVLTTRQTVVAMNYEGGRDALGELDEEPSLRLLDRLAPGVLAAERDALVALYQSVRGLPLALLLVGKYLQLPAHSNQPRRVRAALANVREALRTLGESRGPGAKHPELPEFIPEELKAVFETSYVALTEDARRALRSLWVFPAKPNDFSHEAVQRVAGGGLPDGSVYELADFGLLENCGNDRYTMHQTVADFARGKSGEPAAARLAADYYVSYVEGHGTRYAALYADYRNILNALGLARERHMAAHLVRGANAFYPFLESRGLYAQPEVAALLKDAEQAARRARSRRRPAKVSVLRHAVALLNLGRVGEKCMDYDDAWRYLAEALEAAVAIGDDSLQSQVRLHMGLVLNNLTQYDAAEDALLEAQRRAEAVCDPAHRSRILQRLGDVAFNRGDYAAAQRYNDAGLAFALASDDHERVSALRLNRAVVLIETGRYDEAREELLAALRLSQPAQHLERIVGIKHALGTLCTRKREWEKAEVYLLEGLQDARDIKHQWYTCAICNEQGELHLAREQWDKAFASFKRGEAQSGRSQDLRAHARFGLARCAVANGDTGHAQGLAAEALVIYTAIRHRRCQGVRDWLGTLAASESGGAARPASYRA